MTKLEAMKQKAAEYIKLKSEEKKLKSDLTPLNKELKEYMKSVFLKKLENREDLKKEDLDTDAGTVTFSRRESDVVDEEKMIQYLKENGIQKGIVRRKEYIDYDALESALYNDRFTDEQKSELAKFHSTKYTDVLTFKEA